MFSWSGIPTLALRTLSDVKEVGKSEMAATETESTYISAGRPDRNTIQISENLRTNSITSGVLNNWVWPLNFRGYLINKLRYKYFRFK